MDDENKPLGIMVPVDDFIERENIKLPARLAPTRIQSSLVEQLKLRFLELFGRCGNTEEVCGLMGINPGTVFSWRKEDKFFAVEWDRVRQEDLLPILEERAFRKATEGKGDTLLLMFLMKAYNRRMYDEKFHEEERTKALTIRIVDVDGKYLTKEKEVIDVEEINKADDGIKELDK